MGDWAGGRSAAWREGPNAQQAMKSHLGRKNRLMIFQIHRHTDAEASLAVDSDNHFANWSLNYDNSLIYNNCIQLNFNKTFSLKYLV